MVLTPVQINGSMTGFSNTLLLLREEVQASFTLAASQVPSSASILSGTSARRIHMRVARRTHPCGLRPQTPQRLGESRGASRLRLRPARRASFGLSEQTLNNEHN